jgi:RimJ/RimL family protein N-acetyltransferase
MAQLLEIARGERLHRSVHAYPMTVNAPSNAICRKLGFELLGEADFPARRGGTIRVNDWRLDLFADDPAVPAG